MSPRYRGEVGDLVVGRIVEVRSIHFLLARAARGLSLFEPTVRTQTMEGRNERLPKCSTHVVLDQFARRNSGQFTLFRFFPRHFVLI